MCLLYRVCKKKRERIKTWLSCMDYGSMLTFLQAIQCVKAVLQAYLMIRCTPPADTVMMSALKHHKHVQPCTLSPAFLSNSFHFPSFIRLICCWITSLKLFFFLCLLSLFPHAAHLDLIFSTHAFSHFPNAQCLHCLLPQGRKKRSPPRLRRKKGQAGSGADKTKPLPLWCV